MRPWTSHVLCAMAQRIISHRSELRALDPDEPIEPLLERINALVPDEPKVMMLNARVETDLGLLRERLLEGAVPADGDDDFHPAFRLLYGRLGTKTFLMPYYPQEGAEEAAYRARFGALLERMPDGTHPNVLRQVAIPLRGARTLAAITIYNAMHGPQEFVRFAWRKDMLEADAAWLLKDAWSRLRIRREALRPGDRTLPS